MKSLSRMLLKCSVIVLAPVACNAAGTYYTGNYQSPQVRYTQQAQMQRGYASTNRYSTSYAKNNVNTNTAPRAQQTQNSSKNGFFVDAGLSRQVAMWDFEMKNAGSKLHYDNIDWNVFDISGGYKFDVGNVGLLVSAGFQYGIQAGESTMTDDDITNGGYLQRYVTNDAGTEIVGYQLGSALSIGTSKDGSMMGFNVGLGLTDFFKLGKVKFTPSVGYRYFKYKLETKKNYGISLDTFLVDGGGCSEGPNGEVQCTPALIFVNQTGTGVFKEVSIGLHPDTDTMADDYVINNTGAGYIDTADTFYFEQPGVSHSYEVKWSGPYVALDMDYEINQNNSVNGRVELGLPSYNATGDQPYRPDWQHPKSLEDTADIGSAYHLGLAANWVTAITNTLSLSVGMTYDYYTVSKADSKTYFNADYFQGIYDYRLKNYWNNDEEAMIANDQVAQNILKTEAECPGWVCTDKSEIKSFYKSLGIRVGINAKF